MNPMPKEPAMMVLLGLPFHDLTLTEALDYCVESMAGGQSRYLVTANVDFTAQAYEDPDLKKIVFFADRVLCDGMPLVWLSRWFGVPLRERVAGSDMVPQLLEICARLGHPVYFLGSDLTTLQEAKGIVEARYPGLTVAGLDSPPMGAVVEWDNEELCRRMRASGARLLLVCLGCPKQERWICAHHQETGIPLSIGVGASLDFITGKQKRAPRWMQKTGLEWFWRMSGSPSRLVSRYANDLAFLIKAGMQQAWSQRRRRSLAASAQAPPPLATPPGEALIRLEWHGNLQAGGLAGAPVPEWVGAPVLLDASWVTFMDSSSLGRLALLIRLCRSAGQLLVAVAPSEAFKMAVSRVQMDCLFQMVASESAAMRVVQDHQASGGVSKVTDDGVVWVAFNRSLDALYYEDMMAILESAIADTAGIQVLVVDLREVGFIDSRAVGGLIRVYKLMTARGGSLFYSGARPAVREIIALLRLDKILAEWKGDPAR
jgi:N-acetylglucosaminyldiphosphoundecaprenol N-acetyl-beta-D-mannosaminyltransferase